MRLSVVVGALGARLRTCSTNAYISGSDLLLVSLLDLAGQMSVTHLYLALAAGWNGYMLKANVPLTVKAHCLHRHGGSATKQLEVNSSLTLSKIN